jgi:predicted phosphodiesterase
MRIIGDVHGKVDEYVNIANCSDVSVQLGDMSYDYSRMMRVSEQKHKFLGGNHEDYNKYHKQPHSLGNWGLVNDEISLPFDNKVFFVRGGFSPNVHSLIDEYILTGKQKWFFDEELTDTVLDNAIYNYSVVLPDIVLSHECPTIVKKTFSDYQFIYQKLGWSSKHCSRTEKALQCMFNIHKPKLWLFGHWHRSYDMVIDGTRFICLDKLQYKDIMKEEFSWLETR